MTIDMDQYQYHLGSRNLHRLPMTLSKSLQPITLTFNKLTLILVSSSTQSDMKIPSGAVEKIISREEPEPLLIRYR